MSGVSREDAGEIASLLVAYYKKILKDPECSAAAAKEARHWLEHVAFRYDDEAMPEYDDGLGAVPVFEDE